MADWQFRKYYGPKPDGTEWSPWEDVFEGTVYYSPRTHLKNLENSGMLEFRIKPHEITSCEYEGCSLSVEEFGLCGTHLDLEFSLYADEDPWPDFHDEHLDMKYPLY